MNPPADQQTYRRASVVALVGLAVQLVLALVMTLVAMWSQSPAVAAGVYHLFGGLPVWFVLWLVFHQWRTERAEALEVEQIKAGADTAAAGEIFNAHGDDLQLARKRLAGLIKWGLGSVSLALGCYLLLAGALLLWSNYQRVTVERLVSVTKAAEPGGAPQTVTQTVPITAKRLAEVAMRSDASAMALLFLCLAGAFVAFVVARYVAGLTKASHLLLLRGGASYLMGNALVAVLLALGALSAYLDLRWVLAYLALVVPAVMFLVGLEIIVTFLLSAYRPRRPGEIARPAFDSRVLGLLTSPESIAKAINEAINYQFGFEVSSSWFYQLLGRAVTPLTALGLAILFLISGFVVVAPHQMALITTFGSLGAQPRVVGPGLHLKWPWPIGRTLLFPTGQVQQIEFGSAAGKIEKGKAILWTNPHGQGVEDFFTLPPAAAGSDADPRDDALSAAPGTSLLGVQIVVHYRIDNVLQYATCARDPRKLLQAISERQVNQLFLTQDIDTLLAAGRVTAGDTLRSAINAAASRASLGVEVVFVGLQGVHPPQNNQVADAFLKQIGAQQNRQASIEDARRQRTEILASVAGSEERALRINEAILQLDALRSAGQTGVAEQEAALESMLAQAGGQASRVIFDALSYRWRTAVEARAEALRFGAQSAAHRLAPRYYRARAYYEALAQGLAQSRKFVVDPSLVASPVYRVDLKDASSAWEQTFNLDKE